MQAARKQWDHILLQNVAPDAQGRLALTEGVAPDRQISLSDPEMRHGRKSKSQLIDGYKQYIALDLDTHLTLAAGVLPANAPEAQGADKLRAALDEQGCIQQLFIDCAFTSSQLAKDVAASPGGEVICRAVRVSNGGLYAKTQFQMDLPNNTVTCPAGKLAVIQREFATFDDATCTSCPQRTNCQKPDAKRGRTIHIAPDEAGVQSAA